MQESWHLARNAMNQPAQPTAVTSAKLAPAIPSTIDSANAAFHRVNAAAPSMWTGVVDARAERMIPYAPA
jgi:hypothetical protein